MNIVRSICKEVFGLFVDDGSLALALLAWLAVVAGLRSALPAPRLLAIVLFLGCAAILAENVLRQPHSGRRQDGAG